jgi:DNA-binding FrmR family transcriptional regulator
MLTADKPEPDIIIQLEAAKSSLASAISSLIELMLSEDKEGKTILTERQKETILRLIKKSN